jgi:hypothetical protein
MRIAIMFKNILFNLLHKFCNWAMGVKHGEDAAPIGVYHIQEWE